MASAAALFCSCDSFRRSGMGSSGAPADAVYSSEFYPSESDVETITIVEGEEVILGKLWHDIAEIPYQ